MAVFFSLVTQIGLYLTKKINGNNAIYFRTSLGESRVTKELLSVKDITEITGWSKSTVYKLVKAGQLPTVNIPEAPVRINRIKFMELINGSN